MRDNPLIRELELEDLPEDLREVADAIGIDAMRVLLSRFGGERLYIPFARNLESLVGRYIRRNYRSTEEGSNLRELAMQTGMTLRYVRRVLRDDQTPLSRCE